MAILYKANETDFSHLGLGPLNDAASILVEEERNGIFELQMEYPIDGDRFNDLKADRLIKADANPLLKEQRFKIIRISKPAKGLVTVYAEHISYLAADLPLKPEVSFSGDARMALNTWKSSFVDQTPFTVFSDISTIGKGKWSIDEVENGRKALGGVAGSILDIYGGEYRFDNYHVGLYAQRGNDQGALIAYGKNLTDLTQEEEIATTYTSVYPFARIQKEDGKEELLTLPEFFVDSEYTDRYARRKMFVLDLSSEEGIDTVEKMRSRTKEYIKVNNVGIPKVNLRVKFLDLSKTLDYKDLQLVETIGLCDLVTIYFEKLDVYQKAKVIRTVWNDLIKQYDLIEIGEARASLSKVIDTTVDGKLEGITQLVNTVQIAANGKNKIFRGVAEPAQGMSKNDLWYKPVGDGETELYRFDGAYWQLEKVSAGLLAGTLDAENGDVNLINVNVANIVGETSNFVKSWWNNAAGGGVDIDGNGIVTQSGELLTRINAGKVTNQSGTKSGKVDALGMEISDSSNGQRTKLFSDGLQFDWYSVIRQILQNSEGLTIKPLTGSGNRLNSSLHLVTGPGNDKVAYLELGIPDQQNGNARMQLAKKVLSIRHPIGGELSIADYNFDEALGLIRSGTFRTSPYDGAYLEISGKKIMTPRDGNHNIYIMPSGNGGVTVGSEDSERWPVTALRFVESSNRDSKTNIEGYEGSGRDVVNSLNVVTYNRKQDLKNGITKKDIGFIAEDSEPIQALQPDGTPGINNYSTVAYLVKAAQELDRELRETKKELDETKQELADLKNLLKEKGLI